MKKKLPIIATGVAIGLLLLCVLEIAELKSEVRQLRNDMQNAINNVDHDVSMLRSDLVYILEEAENIIASSEWSYGELDLAAGIAEVVCKISPKEFSPETTKAFVVCNGVEHPMMYEAGSYVAHIEVPISGTSRVTQVMLVDGGTVRSQVVDWYFEPASEALLNVYASWHGSAGGEYGAEAYTWRPELLLDVYVEGRDFEIASAEVVEVLDGVEVGRTPVDFSFEGQKAYVDALSADWTVAVPEAAPHASTAFDYGTSFYCGFHEEIAIPNGSMFEVYVDVTDGDGYVYRALVECIAITEDGTNRDDSREEVAAPCLQAGTIAVFDTDGVVIYEAEGYGAFVREAAGENSLL